MPTDSVVVRTTCTDCGGTASDIPVNAITVILKWGACQHKCFRCDRTQTHVLAPDDIGALIIAGAPFVPVSEWTPYAAEPTDADHAGMAAP